LLHAKEEQLGRFSGLVLYFGIQFILLNGEFNVLGNDLERHSLHKFDEVNEIIRTCVIPSQRQMLAELLLHLGLTDKDPHVLFTLFIQLLFVFGGCMLVDMPVFVEVDTVGHSFL